MLLNLHSYYSLRYGTLSITQLVDGMLANGYDTAVLTDINNSTGALEFVKACRERGLYGLVGMEFRNGDTWLYTGIAKNEAGFRELNEHMTLANREKAPLPETAPEFKQVYVVYPHGKKELNHLRDYEYIGVPFPLLSRIQLEPRSHYERYVIHSPVTFQDAAAYRLHTQLRAIDNNSLISQLPPEKLAGVGETVYSQIGATGPIPRLPGADP